MAQSHSSGTVLVILLSAAVFLVRTAALMLGPLLVALAAAFHTSVSAAGQLAAAINISWALTALFVGPVSDTYGRRRVGLTGLLVMAAGILGSVVAWNYWALLACRLLTGVGAAMIPPNSMAAIADHFPPAKRGTPFSIVLSASFLGPVFAIPLVALLGDPVESGNPADIDDESRLGQPHLHQRQQALAAGENLHVVSMRREEVDRLVERTRRVVFKGAWDHL